MAHNAHSTVHQTTCQVQGTFSFSIVEYGPSWWGVAIGDKGTESRVVWGPEFGENNEVKETGKLVKHSPDQSRECKYHFMFRLDKNQVDELIEAIQGYAPNQNPTKQKRTIWLLMAHDKVGAVLSPEQASKVQEEMLKMDPAMLEDASAIKPKKQH